MAFKGLEFTGIDQMINVDNDKSLQSAWNNSLSHQIAKDQLPEYEKVKEYLVSLLEKIFKI